MKDIVKSLFADKAFNARHHLGAVNSINWARILAQTVYYFLSYFHLHSQLPRRRKFRRTLNSNMSCPLVISATSLQGFMRKKMGLPIGKLVVATNENDILARFWKNGRYEKVDSSPSDRQASLTKDASGVKETLSPAMDILVSSNFERLLWYLAFENADGREGNNQKHDNGV
jgi:threonine synthase